MTMEPNEPNDAVDQALRDAFGVDDRLASRVSDHALVAPPRRRTSLVASLALAVVMLCAGIIAWLSRQPVQRVAMPPPAAELAASLVDGVLIVPIPDDVIVIAGPGRRDDRLPDSSGVVLLEGDVR